MIMVSRILPLLIALLSVQAFAQATEQIHVFENVHVLPMTSEQVFENHTVIVEGDRITEFAPSNILRIKRTSGQLNRADLILLEANPLEDIENLKERAGVMVRGQWFSREQIETKLKEIAAS